MNPLTEYALQDIKLDNSNGEKCLLEKSMDNKNVVKVIRHDKIFYIGSKYCVERDIDNFRKQISDFNVNTIFVVFGLASGEHIINLLNIISKSNKILIIEPDCNIIKLFVDNLKNNKTILDDNRIVLTVCDEKKLYDIFRFFIESFNINNVKFLKFANYEKLYENEYILSHKVIKAYIKAITTNISTNISFSKQFFKCFCKNLKHIFKSTFINDIKDSLHNVPAIVVSAGPSLEKNIKQLKNAENNFLIFSGGRTVSSLKSVNVVPNFVAVIDPGEPSYEVIKDSLNCNAPLLFCESTNYKVVDQYAGKKIFVQEGSNLIEITSEILGKKVDFIFQGGSVAHTCASFATYLGCNPIIFIGQDFAYTNNKLHADIASIEKCNKNRNSTIFVDDINGNKVPTSELFNVYRKNMEYFIDKFPNITFINSSEGGANIKGTKVMDLKDAIKEFGVNQIDLDRVKNLTNQKNDVKIDFVINNLKQELYDINDIKKDSYEAIECSKSILEYYESGKNNNIDLLLNRVNIINKKIDKLKFLGSVLQPTVFNVLMKNEYLEKVNDTEEEKGIKLAKQINNLYKDIISSIEYSLPYIEECISELCCMEG